jgi:hypothetical protein
VLSKPLLVCDHPQRKSVRLFFFFFFLVLQKPRSARVVGLGHRNAPGLGCARPRPAHLGGLSCRPRCPSSHCRCHRLCHQASRPPPARRRLPPLWAVPRCVPPCLTVPRPLRTALFASAAFQNAYAAQRISSPVLWVVAIHCVFLKPHYC